jgi:CubicO group peptidase (beta-lactamase class C family)
MSRILLLIFFSVLSTFKVDAQKNDDVQQKCITDFFEAYNTQKFEDMRNVMSPIFKLVFSKNKVKLMYGTQYEIMGKAYIYKITKKSEGTYLVQIKYHRDTTEIERLGLSITKRGKIIGMNDPRLIYKYPLTNQSNSIADSILKNKIDSISNLKYNVANFNGCVLVLKDKIPFYKKSFGYSDFEHKTLLTENTLFDLASLSKQFTAMSIMLLKKQGKLDYSQKIEDVIPNFPYKNITIKNLLNHTSGLPDYMELFEKHWDKTKIAENRNVLEYLIKYKPKVSFKPGKQYEYSNTGYVVLALIIEKISGKSYAEFLNEHIFQPLDMEYSKVYNTKYLKNETLSNYAKGYTYDTKTQQYVAVTKKADLDFYRYLDGITGDGAVNSSISDLQKWDNALRAYTLIKKEEFNNAIEPVQLKDELSEYGFGWELQSNNKFQKLIYHSGSWGGNMNFILHFLDKDITVIILSNNEYFNIGKFAYTIGEIMN